MVRFGIALENFTSPQEPIKFDDILSMAERVEKLGFDSVWVYDHLILGSKQVFPFLESLTTIAAIAARTTKLKLGTYVLVLPLREPVLLAKVCSAIDHISKGRFVLGVAAGWYEREFRACGVSFEHRGTVTGRNLTLLRRLLNDDDVTTKIGQHDLQHVTIEPKNFGGRRLKIMMGGYVENAVRRIARLSDGWLSYYYTPESFAKTWQRILTYVKEFGRDPGELNSANMLTICVDRDEQKAQRRAHAFSQAYMDLPSWSEASPDSIIAGNADSCAKTLRKHIDAGVGEFVLIPAEYDIEQVEVIMNEVIPSVVG